MVCECVSVCECVLGNQECAPWCVCVCVCVCTVCKAIRSEAVVFPASFPVTFEVLLVICVCACVCTVCTVCTVCEWMM